MPCGQVCSSGMAAPSPQEDTGIDVVNAPQHVWSDLYHELLRAPWWLTLLAISGMVLAVNLVFAIVSLLPGGVATARPGSFADAFFFSVQTLGTAGYGWMYPQSRAANLAVTAESIASIVVVALATGIVFTKFSIPVARLEFARNAVIYLQDGVRTLAIRLANRRGNFIVEAQVRVTFIRAETTIEVIFFYRLYDRPLVRDRSSALSRGWLILHRIEKGGPFEKLTPESMRSEDIQLGIAIHGLDGPTHQNLHARHPHLPGDLR